MIIQCDFDGTITSNNLSFMLRVRFAPDGWRKIDDAYSSGLLTVERSNQTQFSLIQEPKEKLQEFVRQHIEVRPGFVNFIRYCQKSAIPFVIVSSGLDFYIGTVLEQIGLPDLELYCGHTSFGDNGISVSYQNPAGKTINKGFKEGYLTWLKKRYGKVVYIGDGLSDLKAALRADHVFATGELLRLLRAESITCSVFTDFYDLRRQIQLI